MTNFVSLLFVFSFHCCNMILLDALLYHVMMNQFSSFSCCITFGHIPYFQVGIYVAFVRRMRAICAIPVLSPCAEVALKMQLSYVSEEIKVFVRPA